MSFQDQMAKGRKMNSLQNTLTRAKFGIHAVLLGTLLAGLAACNSGNSVSNRPATPTTSEPVAVSVTPTVAAFRDTVYNGKDSQGRTTGILRLHCSTCHVRDITSPNFADGNVNTAFSQLVYIDSNNALVSHTDKDGTPYADLSNPSASRLVTQVLGNHQCWTNCPDDAAELATQIQAWVDAYNGVTSGGGGGGGDPAPVKLIDTLVAPTVDTPKASKSLPDPASGTPSAYSSIHDIVKVRCVGCHVSTSPTPQTPFFADPDIDMRCPESFP